MLSRIVDRGGLIELGQCRDGGQDAARFEWLEQDPP